MIEKLKAAKNLSQAARAWLPLSRTGNPTHPSVLLRWSNPGVLVNGDRVRLEVWKCGGQTMTTEAAIENFLEKLNERSQANGSHESDDVACRDGEVDDVARRGREACLALEKLGA